MAEYFKGIVRQAIPHNSAFTWRKAESWSGNDLKWSNLTEVDATLDTSRFHISLPLFGQESYVVDGKDYQTMPGEYFIFNPRQHARAEGVFKTNVEGACIFLTTGTLAEVAQSIDMPMEKILDAPLYFPWQQQEFVIKNYRLQENSFGRYLCRQRQFLLENPEGQLIDWDTFYYDLATEFLQTHRQIGRHLRAIPSTRTLTKQEIYRRLCLAHCYILENYTEPVSLEDLEKVAFFSKYHIVRLYRHIYGLTPYQHILQLRVAKAIELLQKNYTPTEVAFYLSFSDRRAFAKVFKKITGFAPSVFQEKHALNVQLCRAFP